jgi:N-acetylglucosamine-6-phosphate deacetylase
LPLKTYITASIAYTPLDAIADPVVVVEDGKVARIGPRSDIAIPPGVRHLDFANAVLAPAFVDIHIHGSAGHDVMEGSAGALAAIERFLAKHGVGTYCPTTVTASLEATRRSLQALGVAVKGGPQPGRATAVGIHLEGPFISTAKCGVHPIEHIQEPSVELFQQLQSDANGAIRLMTVAPELHGAEDLIRAAVAARVTVSMGHSNAHTASAQTAIRTGARHATHTFNAMRAIDHREPGILGVVLSDSQVTADIIADGVHVAPEILRLFLTAKGPERAVLITDGTSATGMGDGSFRLGTFEVEVKGERCLAGGKLAGSVLTMDRAVQNVLKFGKWNLQDTIRLATLNPAKVIGVDDRKGSLAPGKDADIVVLNPTGEVLSTLLGGSPL